MPTAHSTAGLAIFDAVHDEFGDTLKIGVGLNSGVVVVSRWSGAAGVLRHR